MTPLARRKIALKQRDPKLLLACTRYWPRNNDRRYGLILQETTFGLSDSERTELDRLQAVADARQNLYAPRRNYEVLRKRTETL
jgi:hypothetical protein